ncbi:SRPBCC family protein [Kribbia dieselivorans]|uniref:SRPBCC family protein n=1 Tax=Kribbia dieselivorans TaxID=331526 RepID=UPI000838E14A|nr:SRPBCC domain-containing protein [Kribbia dieselivorans]
MPVTDIIKDLDNLTLTITAEFAAPPERVWQVYADPRQLERIWGPPTYPATVVDHSFTPGGRVTYYMTSPDGERFYGFMHLTAVNPYTDFEFDDGFADAEFNVNPDLPVAHSVYAFEEAAPGTKATYTSRYPSREALQTVIDMGVEEGSTSAINQIDELLAQAHQPSA